MKPIADEDSLSVIGRNLAHLDDLLHDLLDLAAIDAARFEIDAQPTDLTALVGDVVDRVVSTRDRDRVTVATDGAIVVLADRRRIERVVASLVLSALRYSWVSVTAEIKRDTARVSVIDAGPGMQPSETAHAFDRFRPHNIGRYVTRKIVEAHAGTVGVESVVDRGSRFFFTLPLLRPSRESRIIFAT